MDESVSFHKKLHRDYNLVYIPTMEFNTLNIRYEADGLCLLGLGLRFFDKCGHALLHVLERTLPEDNNAIQAQVTLGVDGDGNGYQLLWKIAKMNIPVFDTIKPIAIPKWPGCIHRFAK